MTLVQNIMSKALILESMFNIQIIHYIKPWTKCSQMHLLLLLLLITNTSGVLTTESKL